MDEKTFFQIILAYLEHSQNRWPGQSIYGLVKAMAGEDFMLFENGGGVPFMVFAGYNETFAAHLGHLLYAYRREGEFHLLAEPLADPRQRWLYFQP